MHDMYTSAVEVVTMLRAAQAHHFRCMLCASGLTPTHKHLSLLFAICRLLCCRYLCVAQPAWGAVSFIPTIVMERALYVREHNDGL